MKKKTRRVDPPEVRFWMKVKSGPDCWEWQATNLNGYGLLGVNGRSVRAPRFSWELHFGHHCDNPRCVRPDHLFLGTNRDNMRDAFKKGRLRVPHGAADNRGERCGSAKLTAIQVKEIREKRDGGSELRPLSLEYGISVTQVHNIVTRKKWSHI